MTLFLSLLQEKFRIKNFFLRSPWVFLLETIFPDKAKVIPIYSLGQIIPGLIERTSQNIILEGKGSKNSFFVKNIKNNSNIKVGDKIFTSGLGGKFPKGYLVGKVGIINDSEEKANLEVVVFSDANFEKGTKVLFIKPWLNI